MITKRILLSPLYFVFLSMLIQTQSAQSIREGGCVPPQSGQSIGKGGVVPPYMHEHIAEYYEKNPEFVAHMINNHQLVTIIWYVLKHKHKYFDYEMYLFVDRLLDALLEKKAIDLSHDPVGTKIKYAVTSLGLECVYTLDWFKLAVKHNLKIKQRLEQMVHKAELEWLAPEAQRKGLELFVQAGISPQ